MLLLSAFNVYIFVIQLVYRTWKISVFINIGNCFKSFKSETKKTVDQTTGISTSQVLENFKVKQ